MNKLHVNNARMGQFIEIIVSQVRENLSERSDNILKAWQETIQESVDDEAKFPKLKVSFGSIVDLEASRIDTTLKFAVAYQTTLSQALPDPDQMELSLANATKKLAEIMRDADATVKISKGKGVKP